uniref:Histone H4 variant n=1 Tax=Emericella nidulans TaxID=162425 RepID=A0A9E6XQ14_EMEND|nr:histone H4 variant [Aspergillus nidulans]
MPSLISVPQSTGLHGLATLQSRRHKKLRESIRGVTRPAIRRLARRGGVYRIKNEIYDEIRIVLKERLAETLKQVCLVMESGTIPSSERKLVTTRDVVYALKRMGQTIYGFDRVSSERRI